MKIAFPYNTFPGGFLKSLTDSFINLGHETFTVEKYAPAFLNRLIRKTRFEPFVSNATLEKDKLYNADFLKQISDYKPDVFINFSGGGLFPTTVKKIKENSKCLMVCFIADNPCDPDPRRDQYLPMTLPYYDIFLNPESVWDKLINNLCVNPKIIRFYGGYDPDKFFPIDKKSISEAERKELECDVSFTGGSYNKSAEGGYRSGILNQLDEFNVKIWGDKGWEYRFEFMPKIKEAYQGSRLSYDKLLKLYSLSKVNLNIPSPQIFTSFQPRVFDIAASKGFQIIDHSNELYNIFDKEEVVTFKSISELKNKIRLYKDNENFKKQIVEAMYNKIKEDYTWENQAKRIIQSL
jgi:spore maturation protein CgeB